MSEELRWVRTHCARMDHGGCALLVGVKGNRIVKVKGDPGGYLNQGYICPKGMALPERLTHPRRLRRPVKRTGARGEGKWEEISWEEAIRTVSHGLDSARQRHGARSVAFCQGMPKGMEHFVLIRLANLFGSPNVVAVQDVCHAPREVTGLHTCGFYPVVDFHQPSKVMVLWGSNVTSTNEEGEIGSLLLKQLKKGTQLIVVDPRETELAKRAKLWLRLRPGTDSALALSFLHVVTEERLYNSEFVKNWTHGFEELKNHVRQYSPEAMAETTWVNANRVREAARLYAHENPAGIQWGNPIEHNVHTFDTVRALICLMAICGNLDVPGGNIQANEPKIMGLGEFVRADRIPSKRTEMIHAYHHTVPRLMTVPPAFFRQAVLQEIPYPVKAAYMQCTNPLLTYADSLQTYDALVKLDFLAVADIFMTPTAAMADIVIPAATQLEFDDIGHYGIGHGYILARPKVVDPPESCWPDIKILHELGKELTPREYWPDRYEELLEAVLAPAGLTYEEFAERGYLKGNDRFQKYQAKGFKTPSGKVELVLSQAEKYGLPPLPRWEGPPAADDSAFPLVLTSAKSPYYLHSSYRWIEKLRKRSPVPTVELHPETAGASGISDGDEVIIETKTGEMIQVARFNGTLHRRVVCASYGWWFPEQGPKDQYDWKSANYNMLTTTEPLGKEFGTPNLKGISCRIRKAR